MHNFLFQQIDESIIKLSTFNRRLIKKLCHGDRVIDILFHFPISVINRSGDLKNFSEKEKLTIVINIVDHIIPKYKSSPYKIIGEYNSEEIKIIYFNYRSHFLRKLFPIGKRVTISGDAKRTLEGIQVIHPDIVTSSNMFEYYIGIEPIYPLTAGLTNRTMRYVIYNLLKKIPEIQEWVPENFIKKYNLIGFSEAINRLHNPQSLDEIVAYENIAKRRIAIDELLANQIRLKQIHNQYSKAFSVSLQQNGRLLEKLNLPFKLTEDQEKCLDEIKKDLSSRKQMNRLIQGDVGSGKTIVAFISMLIVIENGMQAAILAPTEILAVQHFNTIMKLSKGLEINIDIMLSSNRKNRNFQIEKLLLGKTQILVGTHAILEDEIKFKNLGLVIIDEQHRFGVMQRLKFIKKCKYPNVLAMSATPIPRTLLLGCYGDLDVSTITSKPLGRKPINTTIMSISNINELSKRLKNINSQIYWVCPIIEESDNLVDVRTRCDYLKNIFSSDEVRILHGKMKSQEKEKIINSFQRNEFKLLVSTTVIEVGVDIPNANVIIIEHAERFGLAQLHQLRGRVGRGINEAYCILLYHTPISAIGKRRLQLLKNSNDGFYISEEDLKMRGAGDILGKEQSGFGILKFSDFSNNYNLIKIADEISDAMDIYSSEAQFLCDLFNRVDNEVVA